MHKKHIFLTLLIFGVINIYAQTLSVIEFADSLVEKSEFYAKSDKEKTINLLNRAYDIYKKENYKFGLSETNNKISNWYLEENQIDTALSLALKALRYAGELNDSILKARVYLNIGNIYIDLNNYNYSRSYFEKTILYGNNKIKASAIANIGLLYSIEGQPDSAFYYFNKANDLFLSLEDSSISVLSNIAIINMNMGTIAMDKRDYNSAKKFFNKSLRTSYSINDYQRIIFNYLNFSQVFIEEENFKLAEEVAFRAKRISDSLSYSNMEVYAMQALSALYYAKKDYKKAYDFYEEYSRKKDSLSGVDIENKIANLQMKYEAEQQQLQILTLEKEKEINKYRTFTLAALILLFSALVIFYLNKRRLKSRKRAALAEQKKNAALEKLERAKEDILHYTKLVQENNERIECFEKELLNNIKSNSEEIKQKQKTLRSMKILKDEDWVYYKTLFKEVDSVFYEKMMKISNLTEGDKRQILLLKLGYTNKMSADVLGISTEGIKRARQRLAKKLKLEDAGKLEDYFLNL